MARIRYKTFFCAFCIDRNREQAAQEDEQPVAYNLGVDVSHLATPHISSNHSLTILTSSNSANSTPVGDSSSINIADDSNLSLNQSLTQTNMGSQAQFLPSLDHLRGPSECSASQASQLFQDNNNNTSTGSRLHLPPPHNNSQHTPIPSPIAPNLYELNRQASPAQASALQEPVAEPNVSPPVASLRASEREAQQTASNNTANNNKKHDHDKTTGKLSYDIISVREPLAKILADRQHAQQLQQRQILGDHEYIEVYGERGSSCFYEEIASSTTSSATYDQIGTNSNHNYQVLVNSYAAVNRQPLRPDSLGPIPSDSVDHPAASHLSDQNQPGHSSPENVYNLTHVPSALSTDRQTNSPIPSTSKVSQQSQLNHHNEQVLTSQSPPLSNGVGPSSPAKSMPVYSVINKSTRRSNLPSKKLADDRPPQPPPKNPPPPSAIPNQPQQYLLSLTMNKQISHLSGTSSYTSNSNNNNNFGDKPELPSHIPRPPPRFSKLPRFNAISRPLPMPESPCIDSNDGPLTMMALTSRHNGDSESINSGYELLTSNFDDEQIDVGYEKIRECNRYSGGSLSSQFNPLNVLDNGGYESVQPIYSSPSNALVEPNYEAIGPATASEIAAAATARLTAAATVIEQFLKQD